MKAHLILIVLVCFSLIGVTYAKNRQTQLLGSWENTSTKTTLTFLGNNKCHQRSGAEIQKYNCQIIDDSTMMIFLFKVKYKLENNVLTLYGYKGQKETKFTRASNVAKVPTARMKLRKALSKRDFAEAKTQLRKIDKPDAKICESITHMGTTYREYELLKIAAKKDCNFVIPLATLGNKRNFDEFDKIAKLGVNMNKPDQYGRTLLMKSVESGNAEFVQRVLTYKPAINAKDKNGQTARDMVYPKGMHAQQIYDLLDGKPVKILSKRERRQQLANKFRADRAPASANKTKMQKNDPRDKSLTGGSPFDTPPSPVEGGCPSVNSVSAGGMKNIALQGMATQVSTGNWAGIQAEAKLAIDGNTDGTYKSGSVAHTKAHRRAWWLLNLQESKNIKRIAIWNRTDRGPNRRLSNFSVYVLDHSGKIVFQQGYCSKRRFPKKALKIDLPNGIKGKYVKVMLNQNGFLQLAEVQVFAE